MKKMMFLVLTLMLLSAANVNAQITVGGTNNPEPGAVLDLNSTVKGGLLLSNVNITDLDKIPVSTAGFTGYTGNPDVNAALTGMIVYNTYENETIKKGLYVWNGSKWLHVTTEIPVLKSFDLNNLNNDKLLLTVGGNTESVQASNFKWSDGTDSDDQLTIDWKEGPGENGGSTISRLAMEYSVTPGNDYAKWTVTASLQGVERGFDVLVGDQCFNQVPRDKTACEELQISDGSPGRCKWVLHNYDNICMYVENE